MPTYVFKAPGGKEVEVTGEQPPSESELDAIFKAAGVSEAPKDSRSFGKRLMDAAVDVPIGAVKNLGSAVQTIPGVATATDKLYGLPAGASKRAMEPTNATQTAGGYVGDLALMAATAGAEAGPAIMTRGMGYISNPTVLERAKSVAAPAAEVSADLVKAIGKRLVRGPLTTEKVADLIVTYGKDAVRLGLTGTLGYGAYRAFSHLF